MKVHSDFKRCVKLANFENRPLVEIGFSPVASACEHKSAKGFCVFLLLLLSESHLQCGQLLQDQEPVQRRHVPCGQVHQPAQMVSSPTCSLVALTTQHPNSHFGNSKHEGHSWHHNREMRCIQVTWNVSKSFTRDLDCS